jgi:hypothetical protein
MGKSEGVASEALKGPFFTLRPERLGVLRIERICFSKVMVLSPKKTNEEGSAYTTPLPDFFLSSAQVRTRWLLPRLDCLDAVT